MRHIRLTLAAAALLLGTGPGCTAHAILVGSDPLPGQTVTPGPARLVLRFNSRIDQGRSRLELRGTGQNAVLPLGLAPGADQMAADTVLAPGQWTLRWQVLAVDGHLTRGDVPFTVAPAAPDEVPAPGKDPAPSKAP